MDGRFVVIEGLDGAGTTTQAARLVHWLEARGHVVVATHEPTDGPIGRQIRDTLRRRRGSAHRGALPWMFSADRADHLLRTVKPSLAQGKWVVSDRYYHSSLAYQSGDYPLALIDGLNKAFTTPDLTIFLDLPIEACLARIAKRREELEIFEERAVLQATAARYRAVFEMLRERGEPIVELSAEGTVEEVAAAVQATIEEHLS